MLGAAWLAATATCAPTVRELPPCLRAADLEAAVASLPTVTVAAVGDIADCENGGRHAAVADVIERVHPDAVLALGDLAYPNATIDELLDCYGPSFGRFRAVTRPVAGNHEYHTPHAGAYYAYFCGAAGRPFEGWYAFDLGRWHVVALNSNCGDDADVEPSVADELGGCHEGSPQVAWLRAELSRHPRQCKLAMWHHPRWSSSTEGASPGVDTLWRVMVELGVDVVLNGHAHDYQRLPPLDERGAPSARGPRTFIVGTGGAALSRFDDGATLPTEARDDTSHGALRLELRDGSYAWRFVPVPGDPFHDEGEGRCRL